MTQTREDKHKGRKKELYQETIEHETYRNKQTKRTKGRAGEREKGRQNGITTLRKKERTKDGLKKHIQKERTEEHNEKERKADKAAQRDKYRNTEIKSERQGERRKDIIRTDRKNVRASIRTTRNIEANKQ